MSAAQLPAYVLKTWPVMQPGAHAVAAPVARPRSWLKNRGPRNCPAPVALLRTLAALRPDHLTSLHTRIHRVRHAAVRWRCCSVSGVICWSSCVRQRGAGARGAAVEARCVRVQKRRFLQFVLGLPVTLLAGQGVLAENSRAPELPLLYGHFTVLMVSRSSS